MTLQHFGTGIDALLMGPGVIVAIDQAKVEFLNDLFEGVFLRLKMMTSGQILLVGACCFVNQKLKIFIMCLLGLQEL